jgi:fatty acid desaturase
VTEARAITGAEFRALRRRVVEAGGFQRLPWLTSAKFAAHAAGGVALYWACLTAPPWIAAALTPLCAIVLIVAVMTGHEATHGAVYRSARANAALRTAAFPLLSGMSGLYWRHKHNVLHHQNPNTVGLDQDLEVLPFAVGWNFHVHSHPAFRWFQRRLQRGWMFWLLSPLLAWDLRIRGARYLAGEVRHGRVDAELLIDLAAVIAHVLLFVVGPALLFGLDRALAVYLGVWVFGGSWLTLVGLVGHSACPLIDRADDRWAVQFHTTRNLDLNPVLSWCFVGLDRQIEHHLFPQISQFRLRQVSPVVRAFAADHGLPYRETRLDACLAEITAYFDRSWTDETATLAEGRLNRPLGPPRPPVPG